MTKKKSEERIFDNGTKKPSKEEVKKLLKRAEEAAKKRKKETPRKEEASLVKKLDLVIEKVARIDIIEKTLNETREKTDKLEAIYNKAVIGAGNNPTQGEETKDQEGLTNEEILARAQADQEKAAGQQQPGQQPGQGRPFYQTPEYKKLSDKEKREAWEEGAQQQQSQQEQEQQPQQGGKLSSREVLYGAVEIAKVFAPVAQTAIAKSSNSDNPLKLFLDQMKTYESIEQGAISRFFNYMRMLSSGQRQSTMDSVATSPPSTVEQPQVDEGRIK